VKNPVRIAAIVFGAAVAILTVGSFISNFFDNTDCQQYNYNDKLNGGVKVFDNKKYAINICGSGVNNSGFFGNGMDVVQLTVTEEQGKVVAKRRYKVFWEARPGHEPITVGKNSITYQDDDSQKDYTITMPPTFLDWIHARIPLFSTLNF
jgi:hypothetical protein